MFTPNTPSQAADPPLAQLTPVATKSHYPSGVRFPANPAQHVRGASRPASPHEGAFGVRRGVRPGAVETKRADEIFSSALRR